MFYQWGTSIGIQVGNTGVAETFSNGNININECKLEVGTVATPYSPRTLQEELLLCKRYYQKSYQLDVTPGTVIAGDGIIMTTVLDIATGNGGRWFLGIHVNFPIPMKSAPTAVRLWTTTGTLGSWTVGGADRASIGLGNYSQGFWLGNNTGSPITPTAGEAYGCWDAEAEI